MKKLILVTITIFFSAISFSQEVKSYDLLLKDFEYPFPVNYIRLNIQDEALQMAYMDVKPASQNTRTVLLLHGKNFNGAYWQKTAETLSKQGFRVIIPDQVGFGKSSKPLNIQYSFHLLAKNTKALLDSLNISKVSVIGHSTGGMIAVRFTLLYPEIVEKLILEAPLGLKDFERNVPYKSIDDWYKNELTQNYEKLKKYQMENYYHGTWNEEYDKWLKILAGWTKNPQYPVMARISARVYDMIQTQPVVYELDHIEAPMLLILGELDMIGTGKDLVAEETRKIINDPKLEKLSQNKMRIFRMVNIPATGHVPHLETFESFMKEVLRFLK